MRIIQTLLAAVLLAGLSFSVTPLGVGITVAC